MLRAISATRFRNINMVPRDASLLYGLTAKGEPDLHSATTLPVLEQCFHTSPAVRTFILNRPKALHALNTHMVSAIYNRLRLLEQSEAVKCVIIRSSGTQGRAFCAGGDVRSIYYVGKEKQYHLIDEFFRTEYSMNSLIAHLKNIALVSIMDGIVMGGGVGLSIYGKYRIATENTVLAMPESAIGLHPDVGASFYLSRLRPGYGMYMALTGARLEGLQVVSAGFATHVVPSESIQGVLDILQTASSLDHSYISNTLARFERQKPPTSMLPGATVVQEAFTLGSVEQIEERLQRIKGTGTKHDSEFAAAALESMKQGCPTSLKIAFESVTRGKSLTLDDCLKSEFRLTARCVRRHDFYTGVGSVLVTKDRNPSWKPPELSLVKADDIKQFFEPLEKDVKIPELKLEHWKEQSSRVCQQARM